MTISKRTLVQLFVLAMAGVGVAMFVGVLVGANLIQDADSVDAQPVAMSVPQDVESEDCELVPVTSEDEINELEWYAAAEANASYVDQATNSGTIDGSQFSDGGFGDIGQQWWNVTVGGDVTNVHISGDGNMVALDNEINTEIIIAPSIDIPLTTPEVVSSPNEATPTPPATTPTTSTPAEVVETPAAD